jgi:hypothetical protein
MTEHDARVAACITLATAVVTLVAAEFVIRQRVSHSGAAIMPDPAAATFVDFARRAYPPPQPNASSRPLVLLIGNSHTYVLPSLKPGEAMTVGGTGTLPDELAKRLDRGGEGPRVGLLAYPNFLPWEMFVRCVQLDLYGYRPGVVILGLTTRNLARDTALREEVREAFRDPSLADAVVAAAEATSADAAPLRSQVAEQMRRIRREAEAERLKSDADRVDERLFDAARSRLALLRDADEVRRRIYRLLYDKVQRRWEERSAIDFTLSAVDADLRFNRNALQGLLEWYARRGTEVVVYLAPERTDRPPFWNPAEQAEFLDGFRSWATEKGITIVDARGVVPNEWWGFDLETPDRSHFALPGHRALADFLIERAAPLRRKADDNR